MIRRSYVVSIALLVGLLAIFVGERMIGSGAGRTAFGLAGAAVVLGALGVRAFRLRAAEGDRKNVERSLLFLGGLAVLALLLYAWQSDLWAKWAGEGLSKTSPRLAGALAALWPAALAFALLPTFLVELSYAAMQRAPRVELGRTRDALLSGVGMASALVFTFTAYYVAAERDRKWDFSYFRTAKPGEATRNVVRALDQPLAVHAFFPPANEVREQVLEYLTDLAKESKQVEVSVWDQALDPKKARELGVTGNGTIVLARGTRRESMPIGLEIEKARGQLRNFDKEFQKRLLTLARTRRTVYFTTGHGERGADKADPTDQRWTVRILRDLYREQNYDVRNLGVAEGLAQEVPEDAAAVIAIGPTRAFLPEEVSSLHRYVQGGGRLFLALDPEAGLDFADLLGAWGLRFTPTLLASDEAFLPRTRQPSDRINVATVAYSSHPAVTTLGRLGARAPLLLMGAGFLEADPKRPENLRVDFTVHAHPSTWNDANGNFAHDPPAETRKMWELAAAITGKAPEGGDASKEGRVIVVSDSDAFGDPVIENAGNGYLALDGIKWLLGEEAIAGEVSTEQDTPIQHTRKEDVWWFYSTVFLAPAVVLLAGFVATRRGGGRRRRARDERAEAGR